MQTKTEKIIVKILFYLTLIYGICVIVSALSGCSKNAVCKGKQETIGGYK